MEHVTEKQCTLCQEIKPLALFVRQRSKPDGHGCWCKSCHAAKTKAWRDRNPAKAKESVRAYREKTPDYHRRSALRKHYGIEPEDYAILLEQQDGRCGICGRLEADSAKRFLCVDHVADTTLIRGLLCSPCNSAIGLLGHDPEILQSAIAYLMRPPVMEGRRVPQGVHRTGARKPEMVMA